MEARIIRSIEDNTASLSSGSKDMDWEPQTSISSQEAISSQTKAKALIKTSSRHEVYRYDDLIKILEFCFI